MRPAYERFTPAGFPGGEAVTLLVEEYECIRSIDHDGLKQEECAKRMAISRTTVAEIYAAARKKIAESLVHGRPLVIEGGFYQLCDMSAPCGKCCPRAEARQGYCFSPPRKKGEGTMRIAVPYENENGTVFQHFGHSQAFKLYDVKEDAVEKSEVVSTQGSGHGALAGLLKENEVDALICGGIGAGAIEALTDAGIRVYAGVKGAADEAVAQHLAGTLEYTTEANCSHHGEGHEHAEGGHRCSHAHGAGEGQHRHGEGHGH
ncbi:dinitrogenase iron-molybdenum cofactor, partial [Selenomonas sputigena ATCC 35185]